MNGGWMMPPIILAFLIGTVVSIERGLFFFKQRSVIQYQPVMELLEQEKFTDALALIEQHPSPGFRVLAAGITNRLNDSGKAMLAGGIAEVTNMKRGLPILDTVITLGPLLGLLGTIIGMIDSFGIMADQGMGQPHAVTGGIAEALICTAAGIFVAVATLLPYNFFLSQIEKHKEHIEWLATAGEKILSSESIIAHP